MDRHEQKHAVHDFQCVEHEHGDVRVDVDHERHVSVDHCERQRVATSGSWSSSERATTSSCRRSDVEADCDHAPEGVVGAIGPHTKTRLLW